MKLRSKRGLFKSAKDVLPKKEIEKKVESKENEAVTEID